MKFEAWVLGYVVNSLWQVPVLFGAAWVVARLVRRTGPGAEHRVWVGALLLEAGLPAVSANPWGWMKSLWAGEEVGGKVSVLVGPGSATGTWQPGPGASQVLVAAYLIVVGYFSVRLGWAAWRTERLRRAVVPVDLNGTAGACWGRCCEWFGVRNARLATGNVAGPMTLGIWRRVVVLPGAMLAGLPEEDLLAAMAHEFVHMRRRDFAKNLAYEVLTVPVKYHPLLWATRARVVESREEVCDSLAAEFVSGRESYARSLLRLAAKVVEGGSPEVSHAIGMFDANTFERRVMKLTGMQVELRGVRRVAVIGACAVAGLGTCVSALALRTNVAVPTGQAGGVNADRTVRVAGGVMAGQVVSKVAPVYPQEAKEARIQGIVVLHAVIGKDGLIQNLEVISGPPELQRSAIVAVQQWVYKPFLLNGEPTEVSTEITVNYSLSN